MSSLSLFSISSSGASLGTGQSLLSPPFLVYRLLWNYEQLSREIIKGLSHEDVAMGLKSGYVVELTYCLRNTGDDL